MISKHEPLDATCLHVIHRHDGTYTLPGRCSNCGRDYLITYTQTHAVREEMCPNCKTRNVLPVWPRGRDDK